MRLAALLPQAEFDNLMESELRSFGVADERLVTPFHPSNNSPYLVRWYIHDDVLYITCTCASGNQGVACKHLAYIMNYEGYLFDDEDPPGLAHPTRVLDADEWSAFMEDGTPPKGQHGGCQ